MDNVELLEILMPILSDIKDHITKTINARDDEHNAKILSLQTELDLVKQNVAINTAFVEFIEKLAGIVIPPEGEAPLPQNVATIATLQTALLKQSV